ncbi:MAG: hypothetical protein AAFU79_16600, partial [Myxococcota bacterium]
LDEFRRIARDLPRATEVLRVPRPLSPGLSTLQALELDVFQLVYNHGPMQHVFDQSPATDYETARALLALLNQGFLLREGPS